MAPSSVEGRGSSQQDTEGEECSEQSPLLASSSTAQEQQQQQQAPAAGEQQQQQEEAPAPAKPAAPSSSKVAEQQGQCRICLEEDAVSNLEAPCGCTGTQRFTHKDCLQRWINEKHDGVCEVCKKKYEGSGYVVPPPPPPQQPAGEALHLVAPGLGSLYLTVEDGRGLATEHQLLGDSLYDDWDDHRQPTVSWCFSFLMFLLFMMFLHSSMTLSVPADGSATPGAGPGGAGSMTPPGVSPVVDPSAGGGLPAGGAAAAGFAAGASLLFLWLLTKLFLVVLPLLMVMRLAARAQEQAAEAAAEAAVSGLPGRDAPVADGMSTRQFIARLAGRSAAAAGGGAGSGSTMADLEMEVVQARRAALSRLGRDPTFWAPAAAAGAGGEASAAGSASRSQQQQEEQRMIAAMRAMVRAAILNAQREMSERRGSRGAAAAGGDGQGSGDGPQGLRGVV